VSPGSGGINNSGVPSGTAQTAGPSTPPAEAGSARDDNKKKRDDAGRGAEAPLYPRTEGAYSNRGPSTRAGALAQDDTSIFWKFVGAGRRLAELHVNYEQQREYPLERVEKGQLNWRVEKMKLTHPSKRSLGGAPVADKTTLVYNDFLTLKGIPPETFEYRLGNRSALEWVHRSVSSIDGQAQRHRQRPESRR